MEQWFLDKAASIQANPCMCDAFKQKFLAFLHKSIAPPPPLSIEQEEEDDGPSVSNVQAFTLHR
jgi:hypothetical protein